MNKPGIVFMGTPEFAVASLEAILNEGFPVKGVVTSPDKPSGRGLQMRPPPVKEFALKHSQNIMQPLKLKDPEFLNALKTWTADLQVVVAFRMLPEEVWSMPYLGTFNLHASLLPQYRGAAPINHAVMNGETVTGVTTFFLNHEIDKGAIISSREVTIGENETAGDIHDRLMVIGAELVVKTIYDIANRLVIPVEQNQIPLTETTRLAPKIFKDDRKINWHSGARQVHNFIRGLSPDPAAWTEMEGRDGEMLTMKIFMGLPEVKEHNLEPGSVVSDGKLYIMVAVTDGFYRINRLQLEAKKQMGVTDFLRGFPRITEYRFI